MRKSLALVAIVLAVGMTAALDAEARRLGGGRSAGMQRQHVTAPANNTAAPASPGAPVNTAPAAGAAAATAAPAAAAAATKRSWMGPVAGLAAGLGIAALASHFGMGEALANMLTMGLVLMLVLGAVGYVMRKRMAATGALAPAGTAGGAGGTGGSMIGSRIGGGIGAATPATPRADNIPADFDKAGFERTARDQFLALQAANDARDLDRLRDYLSPEMFDDVSAEVASRGSAPQKTEVFGLDAQVLDVTEEADRYVVSVRFTGSIREQAGTMTEDLDEIWHLTKSRRGFGGWVIAGIQQVS